MRRHRHCDAGDVVATWKRYHQPAAADDYDNDAHHDVFASSLQNARNSDDSRSSSLHLSAQRLALHYITLHESRSVYANYDIK